MGLRRVPPPGPERKPKLYGMSEYLMIMHDLEKARLAGLVRKPHQKRGYFPGKNPAIRVVRGILRTNAREVAKCL
jgi:hypothetical protein